MYGKLVVLVILSVAIGGVVLELRHRRLTVMHEMARLHTHIDQVRRETWDLQVRIADRADPGSVKQAVQRQKLALEPQILPPQRGDTAIVRARRGN